MSKIIGQYGASNNLSLDINTNMISVAANATTTPIWTSLGQIINLTDAGPTTITNFPAAPQIGASRTIVCNAATVFTNNANILVQGAANYTAASGDILEIYAITVSTFRITVHQSASLGGGGTSLSTTQMASLGTAQIAAITTTAINALTNTQISQLTSTQMGTFTTTAIAGVTSVQIAALTTTSVSGLTSAQIGALSTTAIGGITSVQIAAISTTAIGGFTSNQLAALSTTAIGGVTSAQIGALSTTALSGLTTTQISSVKPIRNSAFAVNHIFG